MYTYIFKSLSLSIYIYIYVSLLLVGSRLAESAGRRAPGTPGRKTNTLRETLLKKIAIATIIVCIYIYIYTHTGAPRALDGRPRHLPAGMYNSTNKYSKNKYDYYYH